MIRLTLRSLALLAFVLFVTFAGGLVQGHLRDRWGGSAASLAAAEQLKQLPETIGPWETVQTFELRDREQEVLQTYGHIGRIYQHRETGQRVNMSLFVAPAGPASVHTPEICLGSVEFRLHAARSVLSVPNRPDQLWTATFRSVDVEQRPVRVVYGWRYQDAWVASEQPRFTFVGKPYLFRLNLRCVGDDADTKQICEQFLQALLPVTDFQPTS
jgi:hypothetical protein